MSVTRALGELRRAPVKQVPLVIPDSETEAASQGLPSLGFELGATAQWPTYIRLFVEH